MRSVPWALRGQNALSQSTLALVLSLLLCMLLVVGTNLTA